MYRLIVVLSIFIVLNYLLLRFDVIMLVKNKKNYMVRNQYYLSLKRINHEKIEYRYNLFNLVDYFCRVFKEHRGE
ncbi:hypothetical protein A5866_003215 [Enterococcus sp. 12C11_DIV0727]|uniref:Uncharacterized protein n=1 Tax=Candidatus Enterococcus lemimoniae TaxID=1834167 RepID=A0ABZ2T9M2_9ENTE